MSDVRVEVSVPQPLNLAAGQSVDILCEGAGEDWITVYGNGVVRYSQNGGGGVDLTVDLRRAARHLYDELRSSASRRTQ